jgi:hypothetical protein
LDARARNYVGRRVFSKSRKSYRRHKPRTSHTSVPHIKKTPHPILRAPLHTHTPFTAHLFHMFFLRFLRYILDLQRAYPSLQFD